MTCPWGGGVLAIGYITMIVTLVFIIQVILKFKVESLQSSKLTKIRLLNGLVSVSLMLLTWIIMTTYVASLNDLPDDTSSSSTTVTYTRVPFRGGIALEFFNMLFVGAVFAHEVWTFTKGPTGGASSSQPKAQAPPAT